jgi:hypothetical protein
MFCQGIKLIHSEGISAGFSEESEELKVFVVPSLYSSFEANTTEILNVHDPFPYGAQFPRDKMIFLPSVDEIEKFLRGIVSFKLNEESLIQVRNTTVKDFGGFAYQNQLGHIESFCENTLGATRALMSIRALLVQLETTITDEGDHLCGDSENSSSAMETVISRVLGINWPTIVSLASKTPIKLISTVFDSANSSKSAQLDVLKNLLKEDDIPFLEKLVLRTWRQMHLTRTNYVCFSASQHINVHALVSPLAGEVSIIDNKIKAVSHFPSLKLNDVALLRMSGRWFYEVIVLTNGLMQIGWADSHFRCDPVK